MALVILAVLAVTLPFANKAFDWDDREYIEFAQVFENSPLQLHLDNLDYNGHYYEQFRTSHPPGVSYYMAIFLKLGFGVSEVFFRLAFIVFPLIAAVSMYFLARRFTRSALLTTLLLVVTPAFIVTSHSLRGDMPGLAFWLAAVAFFVYGSDKNSWKLLSAAGIALGMGAMIAYQALSLVPLLLLYAIIKRRLRLRVLLSLIVPIVVFGLFAWYNRHKYGSWPVLSYNVGLRYGWNEFDLKLRALVSFIGAAAVFPLAVFPLFFRGKLNILLGFLFLPPLVTWASLYYLGNGDLTLSQALLLAVFVAAGFCLLYMVGASGLSVIRDWVRRRANSGDSLFLMAWFAGVLVYVAVFLPYVSIRYLLPLFPPMLMVFFRVTENLWPARQALRKTFIISTMCLTLATGMAAAIADYNLANAQKAAVEGIAERYGNEGGRRLWVLSEFGPRYYLQKQGFEMLGPSAGGDREPRRGDIVVVSEISSTGVTGPLPPGSSRVLETVTPGDWLPVRIMGESSAAGFYAHTVGPLPFSFSDAPIDVITVNELYWE
ncbi:MAG: glycosyltransferase family 39 protein [Thermoleophilia bacterium]|nr:glycosyltransferase family 39 protein [Thermoleophilia bacterium]